MVMIYSEINISCLGNRYMQKCLYNNIYYTNEDDHYKNITYVVFSASACFWTLKLFPHLTPPVEFKRQLSGWFYSSLGCDKVEGGFKTDYLY